MPLGHIFNKRNLETACHLFVECPYSKQLWSHFAHAFQADSFKPQLWAANYESIQDWFKQLLLCQSAETKKVTQTAAKLICWELWKERNRRIFNKKELSVGALINMIKEEAISWKLAGAPLPLQEQAGGDPFDPG